MNTSSQREEFTLSYDGPAVQEHEMDVEVLAKSLLSFKSLIEHTNTILNSKNTLVSIKIKAGFKEGSLNATIIINYISAILPIVPNIINSITALINFKYFLDGQPPKKIEKMEDGRMAITNSDNGMMIITAPIFNISGNNGIINDLGRAMQPLNEGVDKIAFLKKCENGRIESAITATSNKKNCLIPSIEESIDEDIIRCELEIHGLNIDGSPKNWRFYDVENDVIFTANIADSKFLTDILDKKYNFQSGDSIKVLMKVTKKMITQRKRTERIILEILEYNRPEGEPRVA